MKNAALLMLVVWMAMLASPALAQAPADRRIDVTVIDEQGLAVFGARVTATQRAANLSRTASSSNERFTMAGLTPGVYTVRVSASGFQVQDVSVDVTTQTSQTIEVRLRPAGYTEQLIVTATRSEQRIADVPASVSVVTNEQISQSPAVVADDVLRQVPTFSLFRRTSSIAANPTAQGVSLRGIGPSGVSRTLVLLDDIPFNDPFGGWVYWTRVPMMNAERIEIIDGASSSLYGNYAMGGVINIVTNRPAPQTVIFKPQYGNRSTPKMDLFASHVFGRFGVTFDATTLHTDGYEIVAEEERGSIDNEANVEYQNVSMKVDYSVTDRLNVFARGGIFDEERNNGKIGELNDTNWKFASGGARLQLVDGSNVEARIFYDDQDFFQNTFAVPAAVPARSQSNLSLEKRVPTTAVGTMVTWSRPFQLGARAHVVTAGTDFRQIDGDSDELTFALATGLTPLVHRVAGGTQRFLGAFAQDLIEISPKLQLTLSARIDSWRNFDAHNLETTMATGLPTASNRPTLADKSDTAVSPRVAALYRATDRVSIWGSLSNGFRAPTLKELYSPFRVGAVLTLSNETLGPERLIGQEAGISVAATSKMTVRGTVFNNRVNDPIANVTAAVNNVPATPGCAVAGVTTCRQLQNLGSTNISGFQTDVAYRVNGHWSVSGAYVFDIAKVHESKVDAAGNDLTGKYLAEVPKHRASFQLTYTNPRYLNVAIENQFVGHQFDDDLNTVPIFPQIADKRTVGLPKYSVTNLTLARTVNRNVDVFFGVQNLFGVTYYVGTNPTTIGTPRLVNGGIRLSVGR
jgi:outer membrane receptor protein involved in Fe transport